MKTKEALLTTFVLALQMIHVPMVVAQDDLLDDTSSVLESEEIDIEGQFNRPSPADRIEKMRKKLEQQNEQMVQKKIEEKRIKSEMELMKDLQKKFKSQMSDDDDTVSVRQASTQVVVAAPPAPIVEEKKNRITPYAGLTRFNEACLDGCESKIHAGLAFDTMVSDRFSVGIGLGLTTMSIIDTANTFGQNYYNTGLNNVSTTGDEIDYTRVGLDLNSKFFFTVETKLRPFIGLGLGYERASLKYAKKASQFQNFYGNNSSNLGDDSITGSSVSASGILGAELRLSDSIGVQLDFRYKKNLTNGFGSDSNGQTNNTNYLNFNEIVLSNLGTEIQDSSEAQVNLGLTIGF